MADKLMITVGGMQIDQVFWQRKHGDLSWALNCNLQSFDGSAITYTNEPSNQLCNIFPLGFIVIGTHLVLERDEVIFALVRPESLFTPKASQIVKIKHFNCNSLTPTNVEFNCGCKEGVNLDSTVTTLTPCCLRTPIVETPLTCRDADGNVVQLGDCLNFDIDHPVRMVHKLTNCGYTLYLNDDLNPLRYINLDDPVGLDACHIPFPCFSCDRIKIFKDFCVPDIIAFSIESGGNLQAGTYQGLIAYCDINGNEYTDYFNATNPVPIFDRPITVDTDYYTGKAIKFKINHHTDVFEFFKLAIIKTVNEAAAYFEEGIHRVATPNYITYTGNEPSLIPTSLEKLRTPSPVYIRAKFIAESSSHLLHADLEADPEYNFQPFVNELILNWETVQMPYDPINNYANPIVSARFRTYQRDEVYPFGIIFKLNNGKRTKAYLLIGRPPSPIGSAPDFINNPDLVPVFTTNPDYFNTVVCNPPLPKPRWQIYNTGTTFPPLGLDAQPYPLIDLEERICDITPSERGQMSYWESTEKYPCDKRIWGDLADTPIRYHKFPDSFITHIHDGWMDKNTGPVFPPQPAFSFPLPQSVLDLQYDYDHQSFLYPIGVRLDEKSFNLALANPLVNQIFNPDTQQKDLNINDLICGFEIVRGNRVGHKSIIAKGLLFDVGEFDDADNSGLGIDRKQYYANYPYNDLRKDYYLSNNKHIYDTDDPDDLQEENFRLHGYDNSQFRRWTFHSPDTHFQRPQLGTELKLETEEFGVCRGHFVQVRDHPKYKFLTELDTIIATAIGIAASINIEQTASTKLSVPFGTDSGANVSMNFADMMAQTNIVKDLITTLIPFRNFAYQFNSAGAYNNYVSVANDGHKRRMIDLTRYLSPNMQHIGDIHPVNNFQRESSVYIRTIDSFARPYNRVDVSRYTLGEAGVENNANLLNTPPTLTDNLCKNPERAHDSKIRSYYASMKRDIPDQYGNVDNLRFVTTGYTITLQNGQFVNTYYPIFGGDTFIGREAFKIKHPFFNQNMVGRPDGIDFDYNLVPNLAYPTYYIGTSPAQVRIDDIFNKGTIELLLTGLLIAVGGSLTGEGFTAKFSGAVGQVAMLDGGSKILIKLLNAFLPKNNLDCDTTGIQHGANAPGIQLTYKNIHMSDAVFAVLATITGFLFRPDDILIPNGVEITGADFRNDEFTLFYQSGKFYLASYGIPQYFVESDVNLEFRHGTNILEENFYPNVSKGIPDDWLQEIDVPIKHDNKYHYNATYSIQNSQDLILVFNNYRFDKLCQSDFPNRIIYSERSNNEENFDNWLKYKANNYYDFEKHNGRITGIDSLENNKIIVRFENTFQIFNTRITLQSNSPYEIAVSGSGMFGQEPIEYSKTNTGNAGSQHIAFEQTPHGCFWTDAKRGEVWQFNDTKLSEISRTNYNWFKEHLPFKILLDFPDYNIDNAFKDIGLSMCWDERNERLFITKLDYQLIPQWQGQVTIVNGVFIILILDVATPISLTDPIYFSNKSFTISWSPLINNWVSFYSFLPNYYVSLPTHFQSGIHDNISSSIWNHNLSNLSYQVYYNVLYPYILEFPLSNIPQSEILKAVTVNTDILKYSSETDFFSLKSVNTENYNIFFNKAIVYSKEQCSGLLTLTETPINNMRTRMLYPIYNANNINVLYAKYNKVCTFNNFYDITKNYFNQQPVFTTDWNLLQLQYPMDKVLNIDNTSYSPLNKKIPIRSNECYVRLIQDVHQRYKFINVFEIMNQEEQKNQQK